MSLGSGRRRSMLSPEQNSGRIVLDALNGEDVASVKELINQGRLRVNGLVMGVPPVVHVIKNGDVNMLKLLLKNEADVEVPANGWTPLGIAIREDRLDMVKVLVEAGADLYASSSFGWKPLPFAVESGLVDIVEYLVSVGCDVDDTFQVGPDNRTARSLAAGKPFAHLLDKKVVEKPVINESNKRERKEETQTIPTKAKKVKQERLWTGEDLLDLAKAVDLFCHDDSPAFDMELVDDKVGMLKPAIQKYLSNAKNYVGIAKSLQFADLSKEQWIQIRNQAERKGHEKVAKSKTADQPKKTKKAAVAEKKTKITTNLSFTPLQGYIWYPGEDVLFPNKKTEQQQQQQEQQQQQQPKHREIHNNEERLRLILKEIKDHRQ